MPVRLSAPAVRSVFLKIGTAVLSAVFAFGVGCKPSGPPEPSLQPDSTDGPVWFEDVTDRVGLDFVHDPGPVGTYFTPQSMGSGCAVLDFDGDGLLDIYLLTFGGADSKSVNRLYRQLPGGRFEDVTAGSGLGIPGLNHGVAVGDVNNDGRPDILLTQYGAIRLFLNVGGGRFEDVTSEAGLLNPLWGVSAAFVDYDRDGLLDLVVVNYLDYDPKKECPAVDGGVNYCGPSHFPPITSKLFRNRGPGISGGKPTRTRFEDVSFASGIGRLPGPGLGVVCADFNGDGWPDIFVANDGEPNRLWISKHDGTFVDEAVTRGVAYTMTGKSYAGMGVAVGDVDNDGLLDLYVTHLDIQTNTFWKQGPRGQFRDQTAETGLLATKWRGTGFGTLMADFDLDGAVDLAVVNGRISRGGQAHDTGLGHWETYAERNQLFANDGRGRFRDISSSNPAFSRWNVGRGLVCADFDNDGAPDLLVTTIGDRARLFRNVAPNRGHWLKVRAIEPNLNRDAYGAEVRVRAGGREQIRVANPAESYLASSSPVVLFGLGHATAVDSVHVTWPDGSREVFSGGPVDRVVELRKGEGRTP
ncbi:MAG: hypothetical protein JWO38_1273 [Gemmataceae bacterium]|nr:hypothetical protein [Gemmataceae bacterium]